MKHESTDLRVRRTLKSIRKAFYELILERPFRSISITELTSRAGINRKTFYLHYTSLKELVHEIESEFVSEILALLNELPEDPDIPACISVFYHYLTEGDEVHTKLLCDPEYYFFYSDVVKMLLNDPFFLKFYQDTARPDFVRAYCAAITSIYRAWRADKQSMSLDSLIKYTSSIMLDGFNCVSK